SWTRSPVDDGVHAPACGWITGRYAPGMAHPGALGRLTRAQRQRHRATKELRERDAQAMRLALRLAVRRLFERDLRAHHGAIALHDKDNSDQWSACYTGPSCSRATSSSTR